MRRPTVLLGLLALVLASTAASLETAGHHYSLMEELTPPKIVGNLLTDIKLFNRWNETFRRSVSFHLVNTLPIGHLLTVSPQANLVLNGRLDRDSICAGLAECSSQLKYTVTARSAGLVALINLNLTVLDVNDNSPEFATDSHTLRTVEPGAVDEMFRLPAASDKDSPANGIGPSSYQLVSGDGSVGRIFKLDIDDYGSPRIRLLQRLDRERQSVFALQLRAVDAGTPANTGTLSLTFSVLDDNDSPPVIQRGCSDITRDEDIPVGSVLANVVATDADIGENARLRYSLTVEIDQRGQDFSSADETAYLDTFEFNSADGTLKLARKLDYESVTRFRLTVLVKDAGQRPLSDECVFRVLVKDVNDNKPVVTIQGFKGLGSHLEILESDRPGQPFALMSVDDKDAGDADQITCVSLQSDLQLQKQADGKSYVLSTSTVFDREKLAWKLWTVRCQDSGVPPQRTELLINVTILDRNDNPPRFNWSHERINIQEGGRAGSFILSVPASDDDDGENARITYWLEPPSIERFFRVLNNGTIVAAAELDRETQASYEFRIVAADNGQPRLSTSLSINIGLSDINDCSPSFEDNLDFSVSEGAAVDDLVGQLSPTDRDEGQNGQVVVTPATEGNAAASAFRVDRDGRIYVAQRLDRETQDRYFIRVVATDRGTPQLNGSATVTIRVQDVNDNAPEVRWPSLMNHTTSLSYLTRPNAVVCTVDAIDNDLGRNARLAFSVRRGAGRSSDLFNVNPDTGGVFVSRQLAKSDIGRYELQVLVSDSGESPKTRTARLVLLVDDSPDPATAAGLSASEMNFLLIVVICSVTFVLSCILMASIWHTRRRLTSAAGSNRLYFNGSGGRGKSAAAAAAAGDDEALGEQHAKSPMAPGSDHLPLEALDGRLKMSHASLYSRSDCIVPLHHCHLHDFDAGAGLPVLAPAPGASRLAGGHRGEASGQSSESDSGRGTCFIDDDPFREHALGSLTICGPRGAAAAASSVGGLSTFTMDKSKREPDSSGSSMMRTPPRLARNFVGASAGGGGAGASEHLLNASGPYQTLQQQQQQHPYQQRLCSESRLV